MKKLNLLCVWDILQIPGNFWCLTGPWEGGTRLGNCYICAAREVKAAHGESQKAAIIGAQYEENLPIMGNIWVIFRKNIIFFKL